MSVKLRLALTADLHWGIRKSGDGATRLLVDFLKQQQPDALILAGDVGAGANFASCLALFADLGCIKALVPGNHDIWVEDGDLLGFACWSVTRQGWFGPMATRPDLREGRNRRGVGTGTLAVALAGLAAEGRDRADISWVGPERFYARVAGAQTYRAFRVFSRSLS